MTASVYPSEGFSRAVCRADECRSGNRQRNYWRTGHTSKAAAQRQADEHNRKHHSATDQELERTLRTRPASGPVDELGRAAL
jgi:hypothetical protein